MNWNFGEGKEDRFYTSTLFLAYVYNNLCISMCIIIDNMYMYVYYIMNMYVYYYT